MTSTSERWEVRSREDASVRKVTILTSLGLMTKSYEDNLCDAAVDSGEADKEDESQMQADREIDFELSEGRV